MTHSLSDSLSTLGELRCQESRPQLFGNELLDLLQCRCLYHEVRGDGKRLASGISLGRALWATTTLRGSSRGHTATPRLRALFCLEWPKLWVASLMLEAARQLTVHRLGTRCRPAVSSSMLPAVGFPLASSLVLKSQNVSTVELVCVPLCTVRVPSRKHSYAESQKGSLCWSACPRAQWSPYDFGPLASKKAARGPLAGLLFPTIMGRGPNMTRDAVDLKTEAQSPWQESLEDPRQARWHRYKLRGELEPSPKRPRGSGQLEDCEFTEL